MGPAGLLRQTRERAADLPARAPAPLVPRPQTSAFLLACHPHIPSLPIADQAMQLIRQQRAAAGGGGGGTRSGRGGGSGSGGGGQVDGSSQEPQGSGSDGGGPAGRAVA